MKPWSPRLLVKAKRAPSGDQTARAGSAAGFEDLGRSGTAIEGRPPEVSTAKEGDASAGGRDGGRIAFGDFARGAAIERDDPDVLSGAAGVERGVGDFAGAVGILAADIDDGGGVGSPAEVGEVLAVVGGVRSELAGLVAGRLGHHDIADAAGVGDPGDLAAGGRGGELGGEGRAEHLVEGEGRLGSGGARGEGERGQELHNLRIAGRAA